MTTTKQEVKNFYNDYTVDQKKIGINMRHRYIHKQAKKYGLNTKSNVLEIGCGIGTYTSLLASKVKKGKIVAVDISDVSIKIAKENLTKSHKNIDFIVSDMSDFESSYVFDFVILPDVLEHIPVELHANLFTTIKKYTHENSIVLINIPDPFCLDSIRIYKPEALQIIDQSLRTDELLQNVYVSDFFLHDFKRYSLHYTVEDYNFIVLKRVKKVGKIVFKPFLESAIANTISKIFW